MLQGSRYASETSYYKKLKNEQLQDNASNNEKLVKHFLVGHFSGGEGGGGQFFWGSIFLSEGCNFSRGNFPEGQFFGGNFPRGFYPGSIFPDTILKISSVLRVIESNYPNINVHGFSLIANSHVSK